MSGSRGSALVVALFVLALLAATGIALLGLVEGELRTTAADLRAKRVFYCAESGVEDGRATLHATNGNGGFTDDLVAAAGPNGVIDFDPDTVQAVRDTDGRVTGFTGYGDDVPLRAFASVGDGWFAAFLTNDPGEGRTVTNDGDGRVLVVGVGAGRAGAFEVAEAVVQSYTPLPSLLPSAITILGPLPVFREAVSPSTQYLGDDCEGSGQPGLFAPIVGLVGAGAESHAEAGVLGTPVYASGGYTGTDTVADLTDPSEPTVVGAGLGTIDPRWTSCSDLQNVIAELRGAADVVCPDGSSCTFPPDSPQRIVFVDDDFTMSSSTTGHGVLVVTGRLTATGNAGWQGQIFVVGKGEFVRSGTGSGVMSGGMLLADIDGPDHVVGTADDCTGGTGGFTPALYDDSGGGNAKTFYCSQELVASSPVTRYPVVDFRER